MLPTVRATRYVAPLREGGSMPGLMEADDEGTYVVKIRGTHPERMREIAELDDLEKLVETFKDRRIHNGGTSSSSPVDEKVSIGTKPG